MRLAHRREYFQTMDKDGNGLISFNEWLDFAYKHIMEKVKNGSSVVTTAQLALGFESGRHSRKIEERKSAIMLGVAFQLVLCWMSFC
jgi:hypothetical protein